MNDTTKNMRTAEQLAALADTLERQAAAPLDEAAAALHLAWQSDAAVQFLRRQQAVIDDLRAARSESELEQFLVDVVGVYYVPEPHNYCVWLGQIAQRLRQRADGTNSVS